MRDNIKIYFTRYCIPIWLIAGIAFAYVDKKILNEIGPTKNAISLVISRDLSIRFHQASGLI